MVIFKRTTDENTIMVCGGSSNIIINPQDLIQVSKCCSDKKFMSFRGGHASSHNPCRKPSLRRCWADNASVKQSFWVEWHATSNRLMPLLCMPSFQGASTHRFQATKGTRWLRRLYSLFPKRESKIVTNVVLILTQKGNSSRSLEMTKGQATTRPTSST